MKWTNSKQNLKNLGNDLKLTVVSPILAIIDIVKIPVEAVRDIQQNAKAKKAQATECTEEKEQTAEPKKTAKPKQTAEATA